MRIIPGWIVIAALSVFAAAPRSGCAQEAVDPLHESAAHFEQWSHTIRTAAVRAVGKPEADHTPATLANAQAILVERLRQERWTTDTSVITIADAWQQYESPRPDHDGRRDQGGHLFAGTIACIDQLTPLLQDRPLLLARLYGFKGSLLSLDRRYPAAAQAFAQAVATVTPVTRESALLRAGESLELGTRYAVIGETEKAAAALSTALSPPWLYESDEETKKDLRSIQMRAGSSLIGVHEGDLKALQSLYFMSSYLPDLKPELDAAIKEAGGGEPPKR